MIISSRKIELLLYLLEVKKSTYGTLSNYFEVSKRTIMRDIEELINLGVPIESKSGIGGGVSLSSEYIFSKMFFTKEEVETLIIGQYVLDSIRKNEISNSLIKKLKFLQTNEVVQKEKDLNEYFHVELVDEKVTLKNPVCEIINVGMDRGIYVDIICDDKYRIVPLGYTLKNDGVYLFCTNGVLYYEIFVKDIKKSYLADKKFIKNDYLTYDIVKSQGRIIRMKNV